MIFSAAVVCLVIATAALLYLTYMDARYFLLPNKGNLVLGLAGLGYRVVMTDWSDSTQITATLLSILGGMIVGIGIFLFTRFVSLKWKGVEGIGWGDVKFSAAAGIWLGAANTGLMIGFAAFILLLVGMAVVVITKRPLKDFYLPFGAAAAPATLLLLWALHFNFVTL